jgi:OFA family oxalate/formate antiporter-like MFS transporter
VDEAKRSAQYCHRRRHLLRAGIATLIKWFPDKRGMITGLNIAGFGAGALITAPVAEHLISAVGVSDAFMTLGVIYFILVSAAAFFMNNPPENYRPAGWNPPLKQRQQQAGNDYTLGAALKTWQWYGLWTILSFNTLAGISIISQAAPLAQETTHVSVVVAAGLVGIISIANGAGRFLWAWCSDFIGRTRVFQVMMLTQAIVFFLLSQVHNFGALAVLAFIVLLCYGGGFGTMPAFAADFFGSRNVGSIYGLMLTAWGFAGVCGPTLIAHVRLIKPAQQVIAHGFVDPRVVGARLAKQYVQHFIACLVGHRSAHVFGVGVFFIFCCLLHGHTGHFFCDRQFLNSHPYDHPHS